MSEVYTDNAKSPAVLEPASTFRTRDQFPELMTAWDLTGSGVEVGTHVGTYAEHILKHWPGVLHCVDPYQHQPGFRDLLNQEQSRMEGTYREALKRLAPWIGERCFLHREYSVEQAKLMAPQQFDWVYIDALHDYQNVRADLEAWAPLVRKGGVLAGHDYLQIPSSPHTATTFEVKAAVGDWMGRNGYKPKRDLMLTTEDGFPTWMIRIK